MHDTQEKDARTLLTTYGLIRDSAAGIVNLSSSSINSIGGIGAPFTCHDIATERVKFEMLTDRLRYGVELLRTQTHRRQPMTEDEFEEFAPLLIMGWVDRIPPRHAPAITVHGDDGFFAEAVEVLFEVIRKCDLPVRHGEREMLKRFAVFLGLDLAVLDRLNDAEDHGSEATE